MDSSDAPSVAPPAEDSSALTDVERANRRADVVAICVIFVAAVALAVHLISGWTF